MNDLVVRAHDIAHRVDAQGIMEFVSLWTDLTMSEEVMQTMHSQKLNDMWEEIREFGGHWRSHDVIFERYDHAFDIDWQNYNDWAVATSNGVFRALGFLDPNDNTKLNPVAQDYVVSLLNYHTEAKAFFEFRKQAINKFKNGHYQGDVAATKWHEMMVDIMNRYDTLQTTQLQMTQRMSNDLLRLYMDQYKNLEGYENGLKVMKRYVDFTVQLAHRRQNLMRDMRAWDLSGYQADLRTEELSYHICRSL